MRVTGSLNATTPIDSETDYLRTRQILAEMRAMDLLQLLEAAVLGAPRWRSQAAALLEDIDQGRLP